MVLSPNALTEVLTMHQNPRVHSVMIKKKKTVQHISKPRNMKSNGN